MSFEQFHREMEKFTRRDFLKVLVTGAVVAGGVACGADAILNPDPVQNPSAFPTSEVDPTVEVAKITSASLVEITNQAEKEATIASLPLDRPTTKDGDENIAVYDMQVGNITFKMASYFLTDEQIQKQIKEGLVFTDPKTNLQWTPRTVVYIAGVNANNNFEWGLHLPEVSGIGTEIQNISWTYYTSHFPNNSSEVQSIVRDVFTYQMNGEEALNINFTPTISEPYASMPNYIPGYESNTPLTVNIKSIEDGVGKVLFSLIPPESQLPPEMTEKYLGKFEKTEQGIKQINGVDTNVIYGIKEDETKQVIAMEMEIDGEMRMTGVSETTVYDKENNPHNIYVYIDPNWNSSDPNDDRDPNKRWGRFTVNSETANILFGKSEDPKYPVFWNAIAAQMGLSVDKTIDSIMREREGVINFNVPVGEMNKTTSYSEMTNLPYPADLNKPIVVRTVFSLDDYNRLPKEIKENRSVVSLDTTDEAYGKFVGGLIWTNPDGQLVIYYISTTIEVFFGLDPEKYSSDNTLSKSAAESISRSIYRLCDIMGDSLMNQVSYYNSSTLKAFDANLTTFR